MKTKKEVKEKKKVHRHKWIYDNDSCPNCSYEERCCENCTVCQGREYNTKWVEVSN